MNLLGFILNATEGQFSSYYSSFTFASQVLTPPPVVIPSIDITAILGQTPVYPYVSFPSFELPAITSLPTQSPVLEYSLIPVHTPRLCPLSRPSSRSHS